MRYIICGLHRTGTSALMRAITDSSTLAAHVDPDVEAVIRSREVDATYDPNPDGYFSHRTMFAPVAEWIGDTADESVMKAAPEAFLNGAGSEPLRVVLTSRSRFEIEQSFNRAFGLTVPDHRWQAQAVVEQILNESPNVTVSVVPFVQLVTAPAETFAALATAGWPIDPAVAAATIDPNLYRNL